MSCNVLMLLSLNMTQCILWRCWRC